MATLTQLQEGYSRTAAPLLDKDKLLNSIFSISKLLTTPSHLDEVLSKILDELVDAVGYDRGIIRLFDKSKRYLKTKVVKNFSPEEAKYAFDQPLDIQEHDCIAAKVTKTGQLIAIEDAATDGRITDTDRKLANIYDRGSIFCAPLKIGDEVIGTVVAWRKEETKFFPEEISLLLTFASQMSIIIYNTRLFERDQEKIRQLMVLQEAVSEMNLSGIQSERIAGILITNAVKMMKVGKALLYLPGRENEPCLIHEKGELISGRIDEYRSKIEKSIIRKAMDTNMVLKKQAASLLPASVPVFSGHSSEIAFPIRIKEKVLGVLYLAKKAGGYTEEQVKILDVLVSNAATSYDNAMLHDMLSEETIILKTEVDKLKEREDMLLGFHNILGRSDKMQSIFRMIEEVAGHNTSILIRGASGTGKELLARAIHKQSNRRSKHFVDVNCAAIPGTLLESELFGYEAGAFTDARRKKVGLLEYASGGTLLLDEIGEMTMPLQAKFLRVLEDGYVRRLGGTENIPIDVRFIFSTNRDLNRMVAEGSFRDDLYYRISVVPIIVPTLRERKEDIIILSQYFVEEFNNKFGKKVTGFNREAKKILQEYAWPGNVRELKNIIERVMIVQDMKDIITPEYLPAEIKVNVIGEKIKSNFDRFSPVVPVEGIDYEVLTEQITSEVKGKIIAKALELSKGNKTNAAKLLGISRFKLLREQKRNNRS
jgi:two-component system response regulator AtoC